MGWKGLQGGSVVGEAKWNIVIMGCGELYCPVSHVLWFMWCAVTGDIVLMYNSGAECGAKVFGTICGAKIRSPQLLVWPECQK